MAVYEGQTSNKSEMCVYTTNEVEVDMYSEGLADTMNSDLVCVRTVHTNNCVMGKVRARSGGYVLMTIIDVRGQVDVTSVGYVCSVRGQVNKSMGYVCSVRGQVSKSVG